MRYLCVGLLVISLVPTMVLLAIFFKEKYAGGVLVTVHNGTGEDLSDVTLAYTGGCVKLHTLRDGEHVSWRINPDADSHLELQFLDSTGRLHHRIIPCYIEHNYSGTLAIQIEHDLQVYFIDGVQGPYDGLMEGLHLLPRAKPKREQALPSDESSQ